MGAGTLRVNPFLQHQHPRPAYLQENPFPVPVIGEASWSPNHTVSGPKTGSGWGREKELGGPPGPGLALQGGLLVSGVLTCKTQ